MPISEFYNYIQSSLFGLMGTTATGYGAVLLSSPVVTHKPVQALAWNQLQNDIIRCQIHQTGANPNVLTVVGTGTVINSNVANRAWTQLQFLEVNPSRVANNQLASTRVNTAYSSSPTWDSIWTNTVATGYQTQVSYSWTHPNQMAYFFNLGSSITPEIVTTSTNSTTWQAWQSVVNLANQASFGPAEYALAQANGGVYQHTVPSSITPGPDAKAIVAYYVISGSVLTVTLTFLAGYTAISGPNTPTSVQLTVTNDFVTRYSSNATSGIQAPLPQSLLLGPVLTTNVTPIRAFSFASGSQSTSTEVVLYNNSDVTCTVNNISLFDYTVGALSTTTTIIPAHSTSSFSVSYSGTEAGYFKGSIAIQSDLNNLELLTEVVVGGVLPSSLTLTTNTNDLIVQDFIVDHAGGQYRDFIVSVSSGTGFSYELVPGDVYTSNGFRMTFDPSLASNGLHSQDVSVTVLPLDSSLDSAVIQVPIRITTAIANNELGNWISARGYNNSVIGFSYGYVGGHRTLTVGVGADPAISNSGAPQVAQLKNDADFSTWSEVYRIPLADATAVYHVFEYQIKNINQTPLSYYFGVGNAKNSVCTVHDDGRGNLGIVVNTIREYVTDAGISVTLDGLANAFYYYDETVSRVNQLEEQLVNGVLTHYFAGFDNLGNVITTLLPPNLA
jgi:hypothetical protein